MRRGFTLIELLVVVSIIALLIAILLPVLSRSRAQALMTQCRSNLRQTGIGASAYAVDNAGLLPMNDVAVSKPNLLRHPSGYDVRQSLDGYMEFNLMQCPLAPGTVDLTTTTAQTVESTYFYYWSWQWNIPGGLESEPLEQLDSTLTYGSSSFDILAADLDVIGPNNTETAHPFDGAEAFEWENEPFGSSTFTFKRWNSWGAARTDAIDRNFLRTDGSVQTYAGLTTDYSIYDEMVQVPVFRTIPGLYTYLPSRD